MHPRNALLLALGLASSGFAQDHGPAAPFELYAEETTSAFEFNDVALDFQPGRDTFPIENFGSDSSPGGNCAGIAQCEIDAWTHADPEYDAVLGGRSLSEVGDDHWATESLRDMAMANQGREVPMVTPSADQPLGSLYQDAEGHWQISHDVAMSVPAPGYQEEFAYGSPVFDSNGNVQISYDEGNRWVAEQIHDKIDHGEPVNLGIYGVSEGKPVGHALVGYAARHGEDGVGSEDSMDISVSDPNRDTTFLRFDPAANRFSVGDGGWTQETFHEAGTSYLGPTSVSFVR